MLKMVEIIAIIRKFNLSSIRIPIDFITTKVIIASTC